MNITVKLPDSCTPEEAKVVEKVLTDELNSKWELFKTNANAFFSSLKGLLGHIWNKIATWAQNVWNNLFG